MNIVLFQSHPLVEDCLVFGIKEPSVQELISAVVVTKEGATLSEDDVKNFVNNRYEEWKHTGELVRRRGFDALMMFFVFIDFRSRFCEFCFESFLGCNEKREQQQRH